MRIATQARSEAPALDREEPAHSEAREVHGQTQGHRFSETQAVGLDAPEQQTLQEPDEDLRGKQRDQVVPVESVENNPEERLREDVRQQAAQNQRGRWFLSPDRVSKDNEPLNEAG